ncbi:MAG: serine/threonine-protein kinase, partial [Planctomycetota bacterium]|nr:serine/threonine-protein kinase [Planctomycetota bacterium]
MNKPPTLTHEQFDRVARAFAEIVERELTGDEARAFVHEQSDGDAAVSTSLEDMLRAHEGEDDDRFHAQAMEAVRAETAAADEQIDQVLPEMIGPYRVKRFVAAGGMGTVYEAEQDEPRRRVAIKVIRLELLTKDSIQRFEAEGHLLAGLRHEGIAQVYAMGRTETPAGQVPYLVLEFVDGMTVTDYAASQNLDVRARLELLRHVCDAVQYAHDNGVLHRDLKPGNILVDAEGNPRVLDFGIARPFDDAMSHAALSASGLFLGTLAYMSPEQAMQTGTPPDVRVDVYGVGAVGYELLTGRPPHEIGGMPIHEAVSRVVQREPQSLVSRDPAFAGDLSAVFRKALANERERRYHSVRELDEDLRRFLEHEPVEARAPSALYQLRLLVRRNRTTFLLLGLLMLSLIAGLTIALAQRQTAINAQSVAERTAREANEDRRAAELHAAWSALETGRITDASELLEQAGAQAQDIEWNFLRARAHGAARIRSVEGLGSGFVRFSSDGTHAVTRSTDGRIVVLDMASGTLRPLRPEPFPANARYACATHEAGHVVVHTRERLMVVDAATGSIVRTVDRSAPVVRRVDTADDLFLWYEGSQRTPRLVDLVRGEIVEDERVDALLEGRTLWALAHGRFLLAERLPEVVVLDLHDMSVSRVAQAYPEDAHYPVMDRDGRYLLMPYQYPEVHDLETGATWHIGAEASSVVLDAAFSETGERLALLYLDGEVRVWDVASKRLVQTATDSRLTLQR